MDLDTIKNELLSNIDYKNILEGIIKENSYPKIKIDDGNEIYSIEDNNIEYLTAELIETIVKAEPKLIEEEAKNKTFQLVSLYYIYILLAKSIAQKHQFKIDPNYKVMFLSPDWAGTRGILSTGFNVFLTVGDYANVGMYFGIEGPDRQKRIMLKTWLKDYSLDANTIEFTCLNYDSFHASTFGKEMSITEVNTKTIFSLLKKAYSSK